MNVLFIVADALRPDHLGCYGYPRKTSPVINRLAGEGCLFTNAIANCNHTVPGLLSEFTGLYQVTHGIHSQQNFMKWRDLWQGWKTPFNILTDNGYTVAGDDPAVFSPLGFDREVKDVNIAIRENSSRDFFIWHRPEHTHLPYNPPSPYDSMFLPEDYSITGSTAKKLEVVKTKLIIHKPGLKSKYGMAFFFKVVRLIIVFMIVSLML